MAFLENKKIVIFLHSLLMGGAERQACQLAYFLQTEKKAKVEVWAFCDAQSAAQWLEKHGVTWKIYELDAEKAVKTNHFTTLKTLLKLAWELRKAKPDILLSFLYYPNLILATIWHLTGAKTFIWNQRDIGLGFTGRIIEKFALRNTPFFIANSVAGKQFLESQNIDSQKMGIVHNAVQIPENSTEIEVLRKKYDIEPTCFVGLMLANLTNLKDHATLLKAWKHFLQLSQKPQAILLLAGRLDEHSLKIKALAFDLGLCEKVRFLGQISQINELIGLADLCVFSSSSEGSPNGVLECMAGGLPVVATDIPAIREALGETYPYLVPDKNHEIFAQKIAFFYENTDERKKIGEENKEKILQSYQADNNYQKYTQYIQNLLGS